MERKRFNMIGYDIVAMAACDHGHVMVLNNNSTHYIVAETQTEGSLTMTGGETLEPMHVDPNAWAVALFSYGDSRFEYRYASQALEAALATMTRLVIANTSDEEDIDVQTARILNRKGKCTSCGAEKDTREFVGNVHLCFGCAGQLAPKGGL